MFEGGDGGDKGDMGDDHKISGNLPADAVTVAILGSKLDTALSGIKTIDGKVDTLDGKFDEQAKDIARQQEKTKTLRHDHNELKAKVETIPEGMKGDISRHERGCPAREATITKLLKQTDLPRQYSIQ